MAHYTCYADFGNECKPSVFIDGEEVSKKISNLYSKLQLEILNAPIEFYLTTEFAPKWESYFKKYKKARYQQRMKYLRKRGARK